MAGAEASVSLFGSGAAVAVKAVPPPVWVGVAIIGAVGVVLFHQYARTPDDVSWTNPEQPPDNLPVGVTAMPQVAGATWGAHGMRGRQARKLSLWPQDTDNVAEGSWATIPTTGRPEASTWGGTR